jgi:MFS family permease
MSEEQAQTESAAKQNPLREIARPFIDLFHAPRALWGVNLSYLIEGMVYFGMLSYLAMYFSDFVFQGVPAADVHSHHMVLILTAGITIAMFFLGVVADKYGVRRALIAAFSFMLVGRLLIAGAPTFGLAPNGLWSPLHLVTLGGIVLVVIGYAMYQPGAYAAVRQFTNPKSAGMAYAMLYALMNLGGFLPTFAFLLRDDDYAGLGITGTYWFYAAMTLVALICTAVILSRKTVRRAIARAREETAAMKAAQAKAAEARKEKPVAPDPAQAAPGRIPLHWGLLWLIMMGSALYFLDGTLRIITAVVLVALLGITIGLAPARRWVAAHPFSDLKFFFFIFALMPVQTLFTYNWLILPQYINRTYEGWIGEYFEIGSNFNPLLIFIMVPIVTALTQKAKVYNMMILGTFIMAAPAFLLAITPTWYTLFGYLLIMTLGEAMWQPRFLQYAAEIAPEGRTGVYMGVAQFPWFLTKVLVPLYSGHLLLKYCPPEGTRDTETMWMISGVIAMASCVMLLLAKGWLGKDFKTKSDD